MNELPKEAILCGILYRITAHEGVIIFEEAICFYGCHARMCFEKPKDCGWYLSSSSTWDRLNVNHIKAAHKILCEVYGDTFENKKPLP